MTTEYQGSSPVRIDATPARGITLVCNTCHTQHTSSRTTVRVLEHRALIREVLTLREQLDKVLALAEPEPDYWDGAQGYELHEVAGRNELARYIREALNVTEEAETDD